MQAGQPLKLIRNTYDLAAHTRELEALHDRLNAIAITPAVANLKTDHVATDLDTPAKQAAALNASNAALNQLLQKINLQK